MSKRKMKKREIAASKQLRTEIEKATAANDTAELEVLHGELECLLMHTGSKRARKIAGKLFNRELAERGYWRAEREAEQIAAPEARSA